ncbi:OprO/OprP family phosphate-selective porin [Mucilaginibacter sp. AW1-3]
MTSARFKFLNTLPVAAVLYITLFFLTLSTAYCQKTTDPIPDGTMGEVFESKKADSSAKEKPKDLRWYEFENPYSTLRFQLGFLYDFATFIQNDANKQQVGDLASQFSVRDFRFILSGTLKTKREISWKLGLMYDGPSKSWLVRESGVMVNFPEIAGRIWVGRSKEGYSLVKVMNGYSIWGLERPMSIDIIPIMADGIKYLGYFKKPHIVVNLSALTDWVSQGQKFSTYQYQFVSRIAWLPVYTDANKPVLHIGLNYRWGKVKDDTLQVRSRPEVGAGAYFIDTKKFPVSSSNSIGGEIYYRTGPLMLGTEFNSHMMNSPQTGNPVFTGGQVFALYAFTGEVRPYYTSTGIFGFTKVKHPLSNGGLGSWELLLSYQSYSLNDGTLTGGKFWRFTPAVMWQPNDMFRITVDYGYGMLDRYGTTGTTQFIQTRFMFLL